MAYNIVTNTNIIQDIKRCKYFKTCLGLAATIEKNGARIFNDKDKFSYFYNTTYNTTIYMQGTIGDINFYTDLFIKDPVIAAYSVDNEEFIFDYDVDLLNNKGIEFYLGHIIKEMDIKHDERVKENTVKNEAPKKGNPDLVSFNPGAVTYDDLKAYMEKSNSERYKN